MPFPAGPILRYVGLGQYETVGSTLYVGSRDVILIPDAFRTDLASIPRAFWSLLPPNGTYERAAVVHDFACEALAGHQPMPTPALTSRDADGLFRRVMRECGVGVITRWLLWLGVRLGAIANPCRRPGIWRDVPMMAAVALPTLAVVVAALLGLGWLLALVSPLY